MTNNDTNTDKPDPTYLIVQGYLTDNQKFWSGHKWVSDPSDGCEYAWGAVKVAFRRALDKVTDDERSLSISVVENYGFVSEHVALESVS